MEMMVRWLMKVIHQILTMIGFSVMTALKLCSKIRHIMSAMNVGNTCFANNVMNLLYISMKWSKLPFLVVLVHLQLKKLRNHWKNWHLVKIARRKFLTIWNIFNLLTKVHICWIFYVRNVMINQIFKQRKNSSQSNHKVHQIINNYCKRILKE